MKKETYLKNIIKVSRKVYKEGGKIKPSVCVAMALHETGYLRSNLMVKNRGYFGIKYSGLGDFYEARTTEYYNGIKHIITSRFRKYKNTTDSVKDYYQLFELSRYKNVERKASATYQVEQLIKSGYATDPKYVNQILDIIDNNYLRCLDYYGTSIIDCFITGGIASDINTRYQFSIKLGIKKYIGTRKQNKKMLKLIRKGKLINL